jgi:hypothetical protein
MSTIGGGRPPWGAAIPLYDRAAARAAGFGMAVKLAIAFKQDI